MSPWTLFFAILLFDICSFCNAGFANRTIDDVNGDEVTGNKPIYANDNDWERNCIQPGCTFIPDINQAHDKTFTSAGYIPNTVIPRAELSFTGVSIYIFFILPLGETRCDFILDNEPPTTFEKVRARGQSIDDFEYNALVFSREGLSNLPHNLTFLGSGSRFTTWLAFDYAVYTVDDPSIPPSTTATSPATSGFSSSSISEPPPTSSSTNNRRSRPIPVAAIAVAVVGSVAFLASVLACLMYMNRRDRAKVNPHAAMLFPVGSKDSGHLMTSFTETLVSPIRPRAPPPPPPSSSSSPSARSAGRGSSSGATRAGGSVRRTGQSGRRQALSDRLTVVQGELAKSMIEASGAAGPSSSTTSSTPISRSTSIATNTTATTTTVSGSVVAVSGASSSASPVHQLSESDVAAALTRQMQSQREEIAFLESQLQASMALEPIEEDPPEYRTNYSRSVHGGGQG